MASSGSARVQRASGFFALMLALFVWPLPDSGAQDAEYLRVLETYRSGSLDAAVDTAAAWSLDRIRSSARLLGVHPQPALLKAAVMLHTEAAFTLQPDPRAPQHLDVARRALGRLPRAQTSGGFAPLWHVLAATFQVTQGDINEARRELSPALGKGAHSRYAELMAAALQEVTIRRTQESDLRDNWSSGMLEKMTRDLVAAYETVLNHYPDFLEARLRLGWGLYINRSPAAREHLEQVAARTTRPDIRYLSHLFLGAVAERDKRLDDARREYEAACEAITHQSALVGLLAVASALGDQARVEQATRSLETLPLRAGEDPWTYYNTGLTGDEVFELLRAEARGR